MDVKKIISVVLLLLLSACLQNPLDSSLSVDDATGGGADFQPAIGGDIIALETEGNKLLLDTSSLDDGEDVVLVLYSYSTNSKTSSFQITESVSQKYLETVEDDFEGADADEEIDATESLHGYLREIESGLEEDYSIEELPQYLVKALTVGSEKSFKVLNSFKNSSSFETVKATLLYSSEFFNIYVDNRDVDAFTEEEIESIGSDFAGIVPKQKEIFGDVSDVDGDGKFDVLFTHVVNELGASQGGIVTGFFIGLDLLSESNFAISNQQEALYVLVPDPDGEFASPVSKSFAINNMIKHVLPHELQHMINFNQHYFLNGGASEKNWLNEGLSHLAEDIYSIDTHDYMTSYGLENPSRVSGYLSQIQNICFTCGTNLSERGGSYLFLKYLYEQAEIGNLPLVDSGNELIGALLDTNLRGIDNVVNASVGPDKDNFKDLLGLFALAVYLSNTEYASDDRFEFSGIDIRGLLYDNRGTYLNGPAIQSVSQFPFIDSLKGNGITYLKIPGSLVEAAGGDLELSYSNGVEYGGYLVR